MVLSREAITERYATCLRALGEIATAYSFQGRMDDAARLFQTGEQWLSASETQPEDQARFLLKYAKLLVHRYFLTNSREDLLRSVVQRLCRETSLPLFLMHALLTGGDLAYRQGQRAFAQERFEEARQLVHGLNVAYGIAAANEKLESLAREQQS
jgi:hypothetical protein